MHNYLDQMPLETIDYLCGFLTPKDALALATVSKEWHRLICHSETLWASTLHERFPISWAKAQGDRRKRCSAVCSEDIEFTPYGDGIDYVSLLGQLLRNKYVSSCSDANRCNDKAFADTKKVGFGSRMWGALKAVFVTKELPRLLMLGPDKSGKSTLIRNMDSYMKVLPYPVVGYGVETTSFLGRQVFVWGLSTPPLLLRHFSPSSCGLVIVINSSADDVSYKEDLLSFNNMMEKAQIRPDMPILILANMQDVPGARSAERVAFDVAPFLGEKRLWRVQGASQKRFDYTVKGIEWLIGLS